LHFQVPTRVPTPLENCPRHFEESFCLIVGCCVRECIHFVSKGIEELGRRENHRSPPCFPYSSKVRYLSRYLFIMSGVSSQPKTPRNPPLSSKLFHTSTIHHIPTRSTELGPSLFSPPRSAPGKEKYDVRGCSCVSTFKHGLWACAKPPLAHNWRSLESPRVTFQENEQSTLYTTYAPHTPHITVFDESCR
jgi:hypothetical protein